MEKIKASDTRTADYPIEELFLNRWSPRAMSGEEISEDEFFTLLEAARWAPSSSNNQSWRFIYARRNTPHWNTLFDLLVEGNKAWAKNGAALVVFISKNTFDYNGKPARTHSYDTGAAWENFALQGSLKGLVVHGMAGFDYDRAKEVLSIPDDFTVEAMAVVGKPGNVEELPEKIKKMEKPSDRKKLIEIAFEGTFKK